MVGHLKNTKTQGLIMFLFAYDQLKQDFSSISSIYNTLTDRQMGVWKSITMAQRDKNIPKIPPKYPICPYSPAHTGCVSESDFRMEAWRGALGPHSNGTDKKK